MADRRSNSDSVGDRDESPIAMDMEALERSPGWGWMRKRILRTIEDLRDALENERDQRQIDRIQGELQAWREVLTLPESMAAEGL